MIQTDANKKILKSERITIFLKNQFDMFSYKMNDRDKLMQQRR